MFSRSCNCGGWNSFGEYPVKEYPKTGITPS